MTQYSYEVQIKEFHLDSFGHVNNAKYLQLYEEARWDFITRNGYGLDKVKELQKGPVILEINIQFRKELKNREYIRIETYLGELRRKVNRIEQRILKDNGEIASTATFTMGFFDLVERKLIEPDPLWLQALKG